MFSRKKSSVQLGQTTLENVISFIGSRDPNEPIATVNHTIDQKTLLALGGITLGAVLLIKFI